MFDWVNSALNGIGRALGGLYQVSRGLGTVAKHALRPPTTEVYPDIVPPLPAHFRGRLALTVNPETGEPEVANPQRFVVKNLWYKMCAHDGIDPKSTFVVFSGSNPFSAAYNEAVSQLQGGL